MSGVNASRLTPNVTLSTPDVASLRPFSNVIALIRPAVGTVVGGGVVVVGGGVVVVGGGVVVVGGGVVVVGGGVVVVGGGVVVVGVGDGVAAVPVRGCVQSVQPTFLPGLDGIGAGYALP